MSNLSTLGKALQVYAGDFNDAYPTAHKWCDVLIEQDLVSDKQLICPASGAVRGESSYALNKHIVGRKRSSAPADAVVLFETNFGAGTDSREGRLKDREFHKHLNEGEHSDERVFRLRWNQVGGAEIVATENHDGKSCNILCNDGSVRRIRAEELGELKWKVEEDANSL
jgi:hypothetical protein